VGKGPIFTVEDAARKHTMQQRKYAAAADMVLLKD
jgi:hypothetical protein